MAVVSKNDQDHQKASKVFAEVVKQGWKLYTSSWTWYDALSHVKERPKSGGLEGALRLKELGDYRGMISVLPVTPDVEKEAVAMFWLYDDKAWSVTTCANSVLMRQHRLVYVLSHNHHYQQAGFVTLY